MIFLFGADEFGTGESFSDDPLLPVSRLQTQAASRSSLRNVVWCIHDTVDSVGVIYN